MRLRELADAPKRIVQRGQECGKGSHYFDDVAYICCVEWRTEGVQDAVAESRGFARCGVRRTHGTGQLQAFVAEAMVHLVGHERQLREFLFQLDGRVEEARLHLVGWHCAADDDAGTFPLVAFAQTGVQGSERSSRDFGVGRGRCGQCYGMRETALGKVVAESVRRDECRNVLWHAALVP